jgi:hypothetical protein
VVREIAEIGQEDDVEPTSRLSRVDCERTLQRGTTHSRSRWVERAPSTHVRSHPMPDETPDRDDTPERRSEKREAQEQNTEQATPADRTDRGDAAEEGVLGGVPGHTPARSD